MTTCFQGFRPLVSGSLFISILTWTNCSKASRASSSSWLFYCFLGIILSFFITFFSSFNVQFPSKSQIHFVLFWKDHGSSSLTPEHPQTSPYLTVWGRAGSGKELCTRWREGTHGNLGSGSPSPSGNILEHAVLTTTPLFWGGFWERH